MRAVVVQILTMTECVGGVKKMVTMKVRVVQSHWTLNFVQQASKSSWVLT